MGYGKAISIVLTTEERAALERLVRRRKSAHAIAQRCRIVLLAADGMTNLAIAERVGVGKDTVGIWRQRFADKRLEGLYDEPRVGRPRSIGDDQVEAVVVATLETKPEGATQWSTRTMAKKMGLTQSAVSRIWRAFGLQPHRTEVFQLSADPQLVEKVRDVVGLYLAPPDNAVVFCVDEKTAVQALERSQPLLPLQPGQPERRSHDYSRHELRQAIEAYIEHCNANPTQSHLSGSRRPTESFRASPASRSEPWTSTAHAPGRLLTQDTRAAAP
jgi:transposase